MGPTGGPGGRRPRAGQSAGAGWGWGRAYRHPPRSQGAGPALRLLPFTLSHRKLRSQPGCSASARAARAAAGAVSTCVRPASPPGERVPVRARTPEEAGPGAPEWPAARGPGCCAPWGWSASSALARPPTARQARDPLIATLLRSLTRPRPPLHLEVRRRPAAPGEAWSRLHSPDRVLCRTRALKTLSAPGPRQQGGARSPQDANAATFPVAGRDP